MKRLIKVVLVAGLLLAGAASAFAQSGDRELFFEAESRFRAANYELALDRYETLIREHPASELVPDAQFRRGVVLYRLGRFSDALRVFERVQTRFRSTRYIDLVPFWMGIVQYQLNAYESAVDLLSIFLESSDQDRLRRQAFLYQALAYQELDQDGEATEALQRLFLLAEPADEPYAFSLLLSLYQEADRTRDILSLAEGLDISGIASAWRDSVRLYIAEAQYANGQMEAAAENYRSLETADLDIATIAYQRLFQITSATGSRSELQSVLERAGRRLEDRPAILVDFWTRVGVQSYSAGSPELAEFYLNRVWDLRNRAAVSATVPVFLARIQSDRGQDAQAVETLRDYQNRFGESALLLLHLGDRLVATGEYEEAAQVLGRYLREYPEAESRQQAAYQRGYALYRLGRYVEAREAVNLGLSSAGTTRVGQDLLKLRADIRRRLGNIEGAIADLRDYTALVGEDASARLELAKLLFREGRYALARQTSEELVQERPDLAESAPEVFAEANYIAGLTRITNRDYEQALEYLDSARRALPDTDTETGAYVAYYAAWARYRLGNYEESLSGFSGFLTDNPEHSLAPEAAYLAGWSAFRRADYDRAIELLSQLGSVELETQLLVDSRFLLAQSQASMDNHEEAALTFRELYTDLEGHNLEDDAMFEYARTLETLDRPDRAIEVYEDLSIEHPSSPFARQGIFRIGEIYISRENWEEARTAFAGYRRAFPDGDQVGAALYWEGIASYELDETSGAVLVWERLIQNHRGSAFRPDALRRTAEVYRRRGEFRRALQLYTELSSTYPETAESVDPIVSELVFRISGLSEREASLMSQIEQADGVETAEGRLAILEFGRLIAYESAGDTTDAGLVLPLLRQMYRSEDVPAAQSAEAAFLLGEYRSAIGESEAAAERFLDAVEADAANADLAPRALFRAIEEYVALERTSEARQLLNTLSDGFPDSQFTEAAGELVSGGQQ